MQARHRAFRAKVADSGVMASKFATPEQAIQDGLEARKAGDDDMAAAKLGRAVALAHESGNQDTAKMLAKMVDMIDPATGTVRLKAKIADADEMALDTRSTRPSGSRNYRKDRKAPKLPRRVHTCAHLAMAADASLATVPEEDLRYPMRQTRQSDPRWQ